MPYAILKPKNIRQCWATESEVTLQIQHTTRSKLSTWFNNSSVRHFLSLRKLCRATGLETNPDLKKKLEPKMSFKTIYQRAHLIDNQKCYHGGTSFWNRNRNDVDFIILCSILETDINLVMA